MPRQRIQSSSVVALVMGLATTFACSHAMARKGGDAPLCLRVSDASEITSGRVARVTARDTVVTVRNVLRGEGDATTETLAGASGLAPGAAVLLFAMGSEASARRQVEVLEVDDLSTAEARVRRLVEVLDAATRAERTGHIRRAIESADVETARAVMQLVYFRLPGDSVYAERLVPALLDRIARGPEDLGVLSLQLLRLYATPESMPALVAVIAHPSPHVGQYAHRVVRGLTRSHEVFLKPDASAAERGSAAEAWTAWWVANGETITLAP